MDIFYCKASGDYVELYLKDKQMKLFSGSLKKLESELPSTFLRVHRSYLVNLDQVQSLISEAGGGNLIMSNDEQVPVSRRLMPSVRSAVS
nr:LytTR family DNA-binding domain-containing protein [Aliikangiella sp. G2MR2-5]